MKSLRDMLAGAVVTFAAMFAATALATLQVPGVQGPFLGDQNTNFFSVANAINLNNQNAFSTLTSTTALQASCGVITNPLNVISTSVATGSICLPPAFAGRIVLIANATANAANLFGSNTPFLPGTQDTINGTTGSTANITVLPTAGATTPKNAFCFAPANGAWFCNIGTGP